MTNDSEQDRLIIEEVQEGSSRTLPCSTDDSTGNIIQVSENQSHVSFVRETNTRQKLLFWSLATVRLLESICASLPFPFLTRVILEKGGTLLQAATILQIRMVSQVIFGPIFGYCVGRIGSKSTLFISLLILSLSQCFFSVLSYEDNIQHVIITGLFLRFIYGAAKAALVVAINAVTSEEFEDHVSFIQGVYRGSSSCGHFLGPILGGFLFDSFGMFLPVLFSGCLPSMLLPLFYILLEKRTQESDSDADRPDYMKNLIHPVFLATIFLVSFEYGIIGYFEVILTTYLENFKLSASVAGIGLALEAGAATLLSVLTNYVCEKYSISQRFGISVAAILYSSAMFLFVQQEEVSFVFVGCVLLGVFGSIVHVVSFGEVMANSYSSNENLNSNDAPLNSIADLYISCISIGMFVFPSIICMVQVFTDQTFSDMFFYLALLHLAFAILQGLSTFIWHCLMCTINL